MHMSECVCGGQRTTLGGALFSLYYELKGLKSGWRLYAGNTWTCKVISPFWIFLLEVTLTPKLCLSYFLGWGTKDYVLICLSSWWWSGTEGYPAGENSLGNKQPLRLLWWLGYPHASLQGRIKRPTNQNRYAMEFVIEMGIKAL